MRTLRGGERIRVALLFLLLSALHARSAMSAANDDKIKDFIARQRVLLLREREAVVEQAHLLVSNCSAKVLESRGLALLNLGVVNTNTGLGGKM